MGIKSIFKKMTGKPDTSFNEVDKMVTRELFSPDAPDGKTFIQFIAQKDDNDHWVLMAKTNGNSGRVPVTTQFEISSQAVWEALAKHTGKTKASRDLRLNFDAAFLILRELEEVHLKFDNKPAGTAEPLRHYMAACRLLPQKFQEGLEELYQSRREKGDITLLKDLQSRPTGKRSGGSKPA